MIKRDDQQTDSEGTMQPPLPYVLHHLTQELTQLAKKELGEDEQTRTECLIVLKRLIEEEEDLDAQTDDAFLLNFLRKHKFDVKEAFKTVKNFYKALKNRPDLFRDLAYTRVEEAFSKFPFGFLPFRDRRGCCILLITSKEWDPAQVPMSLLVPTITYCLMHAAIFPATQVAGVQIIYDASGFGLRHLPHLTPSYLLIMAQAMQKTSPLRLRGLHIVHEHVLASHVWSVLRLMLSSKVRQRIHFHGGDMSSLHKHFSPDILPADYGGFLPLYDNSPFQKQVLECSESLDLVFQYGYRRHKTKSSS